MHGVTIKILHTVFRPGGRWEYNNKVYLAGVCVREYTAFD